MINQLVLGWEALESAIKNVTSGIGSETYFTSEDARALSIFRTLESLSTQSEESIQSATGLSQREASHLFEFFNIC